MSRLGSGLSKLIYGVNKVELAEALAGKTGMGKSEAEKALNAVVDIVTDELRAGREVSLTGFGNFSVSARAARTGVNPQNPSQKIQIAATKVPKFKAGKGLKEAVRGR